MIIEWLFTFMVLYFLYKLIFDFIVPVYKTTSQIKSKVNEMNQQQYQQQQYQQRPQQTTTQTREKVNTRPPADDYIDFEEIK